MRWGGGEVVRSAPAQRLTSTKDALSRPSLPTATTGSLVMVVLPHINVGLKQGITTIQYNIVQLYFSTPGTSDRRKN